MRKEIILGLIKKYPGTTFNEILHETNLSNGVISHYLIKLLDNNEIQKEGEKRGKYFVKNIPKKDRMLITILRNKTNNNIIKFLMKKSNDENVCSTREIAEHIKKSNSIVFNPEPSASDTVTVYYIASPRKFQEYTPTGISRGATTTWTIGTHALQAGDLLDGVNFLAADYNVTQTISSVTATTVVTDLNSSALSDPSIYGSIESRYDFYSGWDEFVIIATAISALVKEEADISALFSIKQQVQDRIIAVSEMRDLGEPTTVTDVSNYNSLWNTATA